MTRGTVFSGPTDFLTNTEVWFDLEKISASVEKRVRLLSAVCLGGWRTVTQLPLSGLNTAEGWVSHSFICEKPAKIL